MKIEFVSKRIVLTAKEMKLASRPNTREYEQLIRIMRDLPEFMVTVKQPHVIYNANRGLSYASMEQYIAQHAPERMEAFWSVRSQFGYPAASKWFRDEFAEYSGAVDFCSTLNEAA